MGIDTIAFRGAVHESALSGLPHLRRRLRLDLATGEIDERETSSLSHLASGIEIRVDNRFGRAEARVEASVPRLLRSDNCHPASLAECSGVVRDLYGQASEQLRWECSPEDLRLTRLDLARDFHAPQAAQHLRELADRRRPYMTTHAYMSNRGPGVQTLYRETTRWKVRVYDRAAHYEDQAARKPKERDHLTALAISEKDQLRYEVELKRQVLSERGIHTLHDLTEDGVTALAHEFFLKTGLDTVVSPGWRQARVAAERLATRAELKKLAPMLGQLMVDGEGLPQGQSLPTQKKYRALARSIGMDWEALRRPLSQTAWLDFDSQRLVRLPEPFEAPV